MFQVRNSILHMSFKNVVYVISCLVSWFAIVGLWGFRLKIRGRQLCDLLYVLGSVRSFRRHRQVAEFVAKSLCSKDYSRELQLWPQTLPLVAEYLAWHLDDGRLMTAFLSEVLVPFWRLHPVAVQGHMSSYFNRCYKCLCKKVGVCKQKTIKQSQTLNKNKNSYEFIHVSAGNWDILPPGALVPHHAMAVASAASRAHRLPLDVRQVLCDALCDFGKFGYQRPASKRNRIVFLQLRFSKNRYWVSKWR